MAAPKVVDDHETALEQVVVKAARLRVAERPVAGLAEVGHRITHQLGVVEREDVRALGRDVQRGGGLQDLREVAVGAWVVVVPAEVEAPGVVPGPIARGVEAQAIDA